MQKRSLQASQ